MITTLTIIPIIPIITLLMISLFADHILLPDRDGQTEQWNRALPIGTVTMYCLITNQQFSFYSL